MRSGLARPFGPVELDAGTLAFFQPLTLADVKACRAMGDVSRG